MRASGWLVLAWAATFALSALANPAASLDSILAAHVLRVGTTGDYRPFNALDKASGAY